MKINEALEQSQELYPSGGGQTSFYELLDGENKFRIITGFAVMAKHWLNKQPLGVCFGLAKGCPICKANEEKKKEIVARQDLTDDEKFEELNKLKQSVSFVCYIIDRVDNTIKLAELPYSVSKRIGEWEKDTEYPFEGDVPNFDIKVTRDVKGRKYSTDVGISTIGKGLSAEDKELIGEQILNPEKFVNHMKKKSAKEAGVEYTVEEKVEQLPEIQVEEEQTDAPPDFLQPAGEPAPTPPDEEVTKEDIPF